MDDLSRRFAQGDPEAFEELFNAYQKEVYRWIVRLVRDPRAAEDLTIETFWRAHRAARRFDSDRSFGAWLRTIAVNVACKHLGRQRPEVGMEDLARYACPASADEDLLAGETRSRIQKAFQKLPTSLRSVALLALIEEVPYAEISEVMGLSLGAVKTRVFRAVRLLRKELARQGIRP